MSPHRTERPWQGQTELRAPESTTDVRSRIVTSAPEILAPAVRGIRRIPHTFVFDNDFAGLQPDTPTAQADFEGGAFLLRKVSAAFAGLCASRHGTI